MTSFTAKSSRAKSRLKDHDLVVVTEGLFQGKAAVLTRCTDTACPNIRRDGSAWTGWFTTDEMTVTTQEA